MSRAVVRIVALLAVPALFALGLAVAPPALAGDPCYHGFAIPPSSTGTDTEIKVAPCAFAPTVTYVAAGATVTFYNGPDVTHLVTGADQAWGSRDVELQPGQTVSYHFDRTGIYPYACALHRGMSGAIVVGDPAPPAAGSVAVAATTTDSTAQGTGTAATTFPAIAVLVTVAVAAGAALGAGIAFLMARRRGRGTGEASIDAE